VDLCNASSLALLSQELVHARNDNVEQTVEKAANQRKSRIKYLEQVAPCKARVLPVLRGSPLHLGRGHSWQRFSNRDWSIACFGVLARSSIRSGRLGAPHRGTGDRRHRRQTTDIAAVAGPDRLEPEGRPHGPSRAGRLTPRRTAAVTRARARQARTRHSAAGRTHLLVLLVT
jgi:hypothetical protein